LRKLKHVIVPTERKYVTVEQKQKKARRELLDKLDATAKEMAIREFAKLGLRQ
jgi:hypothetical protein